MSHILKGKKRISDFSWKFIEGNRQKDHSGLIEIFNGCLHNDFLEIKIKLLKTDDAIHIEKIENFMGVKCVKAKLRIHRFNAYVNTF